MASAGFSNRKPTLARITPAARLLRAAIRSNRYRTATIREHARVARHEWARVTSTETDTVLVVLAPQARLDAQSTQQIPTEPRPHVSTAPAAAQHDSLDEHRRSDDDK